MGTAFPLRDVHVDVLEGVLQRLGARAKVWAELVDQRFAAIARRRAWRRRRRLVVDCVPSARLNKILVGPFAVETSDASAAATRFLTNRSAVKQIELVAGRGPSNSHHLVRTFLAALLASERVTLHSLVLTHSATRLFGNTPELAALVRRHSATLREAALTLHEQQFVDQHECVCRALHACPNLSKLTVFGCESCSDGGWLSALKNFVGRLQLPSLVLCNPKPYCINYGMQLAAALPQGQSLRELRLRGVRFQLGATAGCTALANVRLLEDGSSNLLLGFDRAATKTALCRDLPNLETLIITSRLAPDEFYWDDATALVTGFLERAGRGSLAVQVAVYGGGEPQRRSQDEWRDAFAGLLVDRFGAVVTGAYAHPAYAGDAAARARPTLPDEFEHAARSDIIVLRRPNELRRLTFAISAFHC